MTFVRLYGHTPRTKVLDFLGDHPTFWYNAMEIRDRIMAQHVRNPKAILESMVKDKLLLKKDQKYKINTENAIIVSVLKQDFKEAKEEADTAWCISRRW